jgi:nitrite reductase/ring-hydroxylating ferredoxin subunit
LYTFNASTAGKGDTLHTSISALSAGHYTQGDAFQAEKHYLFAAAWLPLGAAAQLAKPGYFVSANIGGWPVFAVRGADGVVRALMNACRHKKMLVLDQAQGHCEHFRCRFHGWTYDLQGRFRDAPPPVAPADLSSNDLHLAPLPCEIAHGMVFASVGSTPPSGDFSLPAGNSGAREYVTAVTTDIACNWKVLLEHALSADAGATGVWQWPLLYAHSLGDAYVIQQIMPRSFLRTRLISHVFGDPGINQASAQAHVSGHAGELQKACETLQTQRAEGRLFSGADNRVAELHRKAAAAYARAVPAA